MIPRFVLFAALVCGIAQGQPSGGLLPKAAVAPSYPPLAALASVSGSVVVQAAVSDAGIVTSARVVSGHPLLKKAAMEAAKKWKFGSAPVRSRTTQMTFKFVLLPEKDRSYQQTTFFPPGKVEIRYTPAKAPVNYGRGAGAGRRVAQILIFNVCVSAELNGVKMAPKTIMNFEL